MSLSDCPPALRGELTRWLIELRPHVYVGNVNARIRDQLWTLACQKLNGGSMVQVWKSPTEQGFMTRSWGMPDYTLTDFEGVTLVTRPHGTFNVQEDTDLPDMAQES